MAEGKSEVVKSSTTTRSSSSTTTKVTVRRTSSRSRSASPGRARSPSRRKSLNRSPSPHRYNTRHKAPGAEEEAGCCSVRGSVREGCQLLSRAAKQLSPILRDLATCTVYVVLAYVALTMCSYGKCNIAVPKVPSLAVLYNEQATVETAVWLLITSLLFLVPLGQVVKGVPTDRGILSYLCNSPFVTVSLLGLHLAAYKYDPKLLDCSGKELQFTFSTILLVVITAVCLEWRFKCLGRIYNTAAAILCLYLLEKRFNISGYSDIYFSSAILVFAMTLTTYSLIKALFREHDNCATQAASRGLLLIVVTWYLSHNNYPIPQKHCFINTAGLMSIVALVITLLYILYKHKECAKACSVMVLAVGVATGVLIKQKYLLIPAKCPYLSLWYGFNMGCCVDALFVIAKGGFKTNFFGFKPVNFIKRVLEGPHDPRLGLDEDSGLDLKFFCIRVGYLCPLLFCATTGVQMYSAKTLTCPVSTLLAMTALYTATKLTCLEKAITSSSEIIDKRCSVGFMLWSLVLQPNFSLLPLRYSLSVPATAPLGPCSYHTYLMIATFTVGLVLHAISTLQGHYLLIGENHPLLKSLTTLSAQGDEKIPISGLWRFMRYPFITGDLMCVMSMALFCGVDAPLLYLPPAVLLLRSLFVIRSYNKISPSFYGVRVWKSYQEMVKYNIIPGVW